MGLKFMPLLYLYLLFGQTNPSPSDLVQFWPNTDSHAENAEKVIEIAQKNREIADKRAGPVIVGGRPCY